MNNNILIGVVGLIIIVIGFFIYGAMTDDSSVDTNDVTATTTRSATSAEVEAQLEREAEERAESDAAELEAKKVAFTIDVANLPEAQQTSLRVIGLDDTSIDITNAMLSCARVDMSETRVNEIKDGAVVTAGEGIRLISCYNTNR